MSKLTGAMAQAAAYPNDVRLQLSAGYAAETEGKIELALKYFDLAFSMGLPIDVRHRLFFAYGKALRKAGRLEESEKILSQAITEFPSELGYPVQLAMTLDRSGRSTEAVAYLLELLVRCRHLVIEMATQKPEIVEFLAELGFESSAAED